MPYSRPTLSELRTEAIQDIQGADLSGIDSQLRFGILPVLAYAMAGLAYEHYAYQDWIAEQAVPWTSSDEFLYGWGALRGVLPEDATAASGPVTFTATSPATAPADIPAGTPINRSDGVAYTTTADAVLAAGSTTVTVTVKATVPAAASEAAAGTTFLLVAPISGAPPTGVASAEIAGGADQETQDAYKNRVLAAYAAPSQGGAITDYEAWALAVPGVTRVWVVPLGNGPGTVVIYFMEDVTQAAYGGFPQGTNGVAAAETRATAATGDQLVLANYIYPRRPVTALVYAEAPAAQAVNYTIANLSPATTLIKNAITAALTAMHASDVISPGGTLYPNSWETAIAGVEGITTFTVSSPSAPITAPSGTLLTLGTITYT
jgi:uncharacterized phage protein gp47/JayE